MGKYRLLTTVFILTVVSLISGCSNNLAKNQNIETQETNVESIQESEEPLTSIQTSYLSSDILTYKTATEFDHSEDVIFQNKYSDIEGIFTFRGNALRNSPSFGKADIKEENLEIAWQFNTSSSSWGGGAGWTGQPSIVKWTKELRESMNIYDEFKNKEDFTEVI